MTTSSKVAPLASTMALTFCNVRVVWAPTSPGWRYSLVAGSTGPWPETWTNGPFRTPWEKVCAGEGASEVRTAVLSVTSCLSWIVPAGIPAEFVGDRLRRSANLRQRGQNLFVVEEHVGHRHRYRGGHGARTVADRHRNAVHEALVFLLILGVPLRGNEFHLGEVAFWRVDGALGELGVFDPFGDLPPLRPRQACYQNLADGGAVQGSGSAHPRVHPHALDRVQFVDVDGLGRLVDREVDGLAGAGVQRAQVRTCQRPHVPLLESAVGQLEEPRSQHVAVVGVVPDEALGLHRAKQPQHRRLVHVELYRELLQRLRALTEGAQDGECARQ